MIIEVTMPVLGLTMEEATIIEWSKAEGDAVERDETILVVETDKAATDVPSPAAGILARIIAAPGEAVPVGTVIGYLAETEADLPKVPQTAVAVAASAAIDPSTPTPAAVAAAVHHEGNAARVVPGQRVFASPRARTKARQLGVDLVDVPPVGERIIEQDVLRAAAAASQPRQGARATPLAARLAAELGIDLDALVASSERRIRSTDLLLAAALAPDSVSEPGGSAEEKPTTVVPASETKPLNRVRRITGERMTLSSQTAPQVTYQMRCDMTRAVKLRAELKEEAEARGVKLSFDAMFVRAVATALTEFPDANAQFVEGEGVRRFAAANVGVAVDLGDNGLIVPVIRGAARRGLFDIAAELYRLVGLARESKLGPDDYKGGTFTISNLGLLGIETFTPIINLPEAAILGIGAITPMPVFDRGELTERQMTMLALTSDHRVLDGAPTARFLGRIRTIMEQPLLLLEKGL